MTPPNQPNPPSLADFESARFDAAEAYAPIRAADAWVRYEIELAYKAGANHARTFTLGSAEVVAILGYAAHRETCRIHRMDNVCTCGLSDALEAFAKVRE